MKKLAGAAIALGVLFALTPPTSLAVEGGRGEAGMARRPLPSLRLAAKRIPAPELNAVVRQYCQKCHNDTQRRGNMSLVGFDVANAPAMADIAEKMVAKLRSGMMPPPGQSRPTADTLAALTLSLETQLDSAAAAKPNPGHRTFQRLNRAEYSAAIRDLLGVDVDAGNWLPLDTKSENFDNIADAQLFSPTLLDAYLRAASDISRLVVGDPRAAPLSATYSVPRTASQLEHVEGAPMGTRGGVSAVHTFPADGAYVFRVFFYHETTGAFAGGNARNEKVEISIDGVRVALLDMDRWMTASDPNGVSMASEAVRITAGPHRVSAAFIPPAFQGVAQDLVAPLKWSLASTSNATAYGFSLLPHLRDLVITGPSNPTGVSESAMRRRVFSCMPGVAATGIAGRSCARTIVTRLAGDAYRRPVTARDVDPLMAFYDSASATAARAAAPASGFEVGVRTALEAILASPDFVFRFETAPAAAKPGENYRVSDLALASRLSFFLWSGPPDRALLAVARQGRLSDTKTLGAEVRRMLRDPRAATLATRFAAQWLRLSDVDKVQPDVRQYPDFDEQLREAMKRETEVFFEHLVREDRDVLELFSADYTYVNERLATHYGIPGVAGPAFRRVKQVDAERRGLLAHASILTLTSHATRTSPVERGKWVMEVFLNSPPPPPPPGVPDLEATPDAKDGRTFSVRERMEEHRRSPACQSCHRMMDPIGLALEHYDVTGRWRVRDNGAAIDSRGDLWDGTKVEKPSDLRDALLKHRESLLRVFTRNLMAYALGRRVEAYDMPAVRGIVRAAGANENRMSAFVLGVVNTPAFRMQRLETNTEGQSK